MTNKTQIAKIHKYNVKFTESYRFGFNGTETDNDITGSFGNTYTTMFRAYDSRIGRWWSIDPETAQLPWESPYVSMGNNPILMVDPLGNLEDWFYYEVSGEINYDSEMRKGDEQELGDDWKHLGKNFF